MYEVCKTLNLWIKNINLNYMLVSFFSFAPHLIRWGLKQKNDIHMLNYYKHLADNTTLAQSSDHVS